MKTMPTPLPPSKEFMVLSHNKLIENMSHEQLLTHAKTMFQNMVEMEVCMADIFGKISGVKKILLPGDTVKTPEGHRGFINEIHAKVSTVERGIQTYTLDQLTFVQSGLNMETQENVK